VTVLNEVTQVTTQSLWSTDASHLSVPWTRTETAKQVFCVAAPNIWKSLQNDIRNASSLSTFRAKLKTHFLLLHEHTHLCASVLTFS